MDKISSFSSVLPFNPIVNDAVLSLAMYGTTLYAGGEFTNVDGFFASQGAAVSAAGVVTPSFPAVNGYIGVTIPDGAGGWYIGGSFGNMGGNTGRKRYGTVTTCP